jgi:O-antigen biosynthesis protein
LQETKDIIGRQKKRFHTLTSAFRPGNVEGRYCLLLGVCTKLPLPVMARHRLWSWGLDHIVGRERTLLAANFRPAQEAWDKKGRDHLDQLLQGNERLAVPAVNNPVVSFVVVLHNRAHLSLLSMESIVANAGVNFELIVVNNASTDDTGVMLERWQGAKVISNPTNAGFGPACMQAADRAEGEHLCLLNNDALLTPGAMRAALANFANAKVGAVGGKILHANGELQEAGAMVLPNGHVAGYGRGDDPNAPQYNFSRPVDYCSGVFLLTPRRVFTELGGFSAEFAPAYYEDVDYCMTLWHRGLQVIYEPLAVIQHYGSATTGGTDYGAILSEHNRKKFLQKWGPTLKPRFAPGS